jgi:hypothetical protein
MYNTMNHKNNTSIYNQSTSYRYSSASCHTGFRVFIGKRKHTTMVPRRASASSFASNTAIAGFTPNML